MRSKFKKKHLITISVILAIFLFVSCSSSNNVLISGKVTNSLNGVGISGVDVLIDGVVMNTSNADGVFEFNTPSGTYQLKFNETGYSIDSYSLTAIEGVPVVIPEKDTLASPMILDTSAFSIELTWGALPKDLDGMVRVATKASAPEYFEIDKDDRDGNGHETMTVSRIEEGFDFIYSVGICDEPGSFLDSEVNVRINFDNKHIDIKPASIADVGNLWNVFKVEGTKIMLIDEITVSEKN